MYKYESLQRHHNPFKAPRHGSGYRLPMPSPVVRTWVDGLPSDPRIADALRDDFGSLVQFIPQEVSISLGHRDI